jgi:hypothetical protein
MKYAAAPSAKCAAHAEKSPSDLGMKSCTPGESDARTRDLSGGERAGSGEPRAGSGERRAESGEPRTESGIPRPNHKLPRPLRGPPRPPSGKPHPPSGHPHPSRPPPPTPRSKAATTPAPDSMFLVLCQCPVPSPECLPPAHCPIPNAQPLNAEVAESAESNMQPDRQGGLPRPNGAAACSHGWSAARCLAGGAQPVDRRCIWAGCPGGAEESHTASSARALFKTPPPLPGRVGIASVIHGLRCAPPVATSQRPFGADEPNQSTMYFSSNSTPWAWSIRSNSDLKSSFL